MISREQFDAYNRAVDNLSDAARREIESGIWAWLQTDEGRAASVAECREYAKEVMAGVIQRYDEAAASLAAQWYDRQAEDNHIKLPAAVTAAAYSPERVDETARYQAKKLVKGDLRGFARYCGDLARNDVLLSLNETIMRNAGRDARRGVRFARVPTGTETCTFCLMLASRGAVYRTRETAGLFRHFHRGCNCKVVPGFEDSPDAELVEGVRPERMREQWRRFEEIDADKSLSSEQRESAKRAILNRDAAKDRPSTAYRADNLDLSRLHSGELGRMQKKNPLEWEGYAHLSRLGYEQALLHEQGNASANIDVLMQLGGEWHYWDMKTIEKGIHALRKRMTECYSKWERLTEEGATVPDGIDLSMLGDPRAIIDNRYSEITDDEARRQIRASMDYLSGKGVFDFPQSMLILKDGTVEVIDK